MTLYKTHLQPVQALTAHSPKRACKHFHTIHGCQKQQFCPKHTCAPKTQDTLPVLSEIVAFKDPLALYIGSPSSLGSSFVIKIQAYARRIELERMC